MPHWSLARRAWTWPVVQCKWCPSQQSMFQSRSTRRKALYRLTRVGPRNYTWTQFLLIWNDYENCVNLQSSYCKNKLVNIHAVKNPVVHFKIITAFHHSLFDNQMISIDKNSIHYQQCGSGVLTDGNENVFLYTVFSCFARSSLRRFSLIKVFNIT